MRICLLYIEGVLTFKGFNTTVKVLDFINSLSSTYANTDVGIITDMNETELKEKMGADILTNTNIKYIFIENGIKTYKDGVMIHNTNLITKYGNNKVTEMKDFCLTYNKRHYYCMQRRGFVKIYDSMIKVYPVGEDCRYWENIAFEQHDDMRKLRDEYMYDFNSEFGRFDIKIRKRGQTNFIVYPNGWEENYCLQFLTDYNKIKYYYIDPECHINVNIGNHLVQIQVKDPEDMIESVSSSIML
jgi:hypothetical protein